MLRAGNRYNPVRGGQQNENVFLKGSLLPSTSKTMTIYVTKIRESPRSFNAPFIVEFEHPEPGVENCNAWPLNKTNTARLCEMLATEQGVAPSNADLEQGINRKWLLAVVLETDPNKDEQVRSLALFRLGPHWRAVRPAKQEMSDLGISDADIPEDFRMDGLEDPGTGKVVT